MPPALKQLHQLLTKGLQATAALWPPLEHAYCFLDQAKVILANESQDTGSRASTSDEPLAGGEPFQASWFVARFA